MATTKRKLTRRQLARKHEQQRRDEEVRDRAQPPWLRDPEYDAYLERRDAAEAVEEAEKRAAKASERARTRKAKRAAAADEEHPPEQGRGETAAAYTKSAPERAKKEKGEEQERSEAPTADKGQREEGTRCGDTEAPASAKPASTAQQGGKQTSAGSGRNGVTGRTSQKPGRVTSEFTTGFVAASVTVWKPQHDALRAYFDQHCAEAGVEDKDGQWRLYAHVAMSQARLNVKGDWTGTRTSGVPVHCRLVEALDEPGSGRRRSAPAVWSQLVEAGLFQVSDYVRPGAAPGRTREFAVHPDILDLLADLIPMTSTDLPQRVDLYSGKRNRGVGARSVVRMDGNRVGADLYHKALASLDVGYYYEPAVGQHLAALQERRDTLRSALERAGGHEYVTALQERLQVAQEALAVDRETGEVKRWTYAQERDVVRGYEAEHGEPRTEEFRAYQRARHQHLNDRACFSAVLHQLPEPTEVEGVKRYRLAYNHQTSGRMSAIGGMFQSCSREMNEAAHAHLDNVYNYDLVSSQASFLLELFEEASAAENGPDRPFDGSWVEAYVAEPVPGEPKPKVWAAEAVGISVDTWKTCLYAVLMGASLESTVHESTGAVAAALRADAACQTPETLEAAWARLKSYLGPFYKELRRWHSWLDKTYAQDKAASGPHRGGGRWVRNAAGETYHWLKDTPGHKRKSQLAAHLLQGREASYVLNLITLAPKHGYTVIANMHDGVITIGEISESAMAAASALAASTRAVLEIKPYK